MYKSVEKLKFKSLVMSANYARYVIYHYVTKFFLVHPTLLIHIQILHNALSLLYCLRAFFFSRLWVSCLQWDVRQGKGDLQLSRLSQTLPFGHRLSALHVHSLLGWNHRNHLQRFRYQKDPLGVSTFSLIIWHSKPVKVQRKFIIANGNTTKINLLWLMSMKTFLKTTILDWLLLSLTTFCF